MRYVVNEVTATTPAGSKQTPSLQKQSQQNITALGTAVTTGLDGIIRDAATGKPTTLSADLDRFGAGQQNIA